MIFNWEFCSNHIEYCLWLKMLSCNLLLLPHVLLIWLLLTLEMLLKSSPLPPTQRGFRSPKYWVLFNWELRNFYIIIFEMLQLYIDITCARDCVGDIRCQKVFFSSSNFHNRTKLIFQLSLDILFLRMNKHCDTNSYTKETCFLEKCFQPLYLTFPVLVVSACKFRRIAD